MKHKYLIVTSVFLSLLMMLQPISVTPAATDKPIGGVVRTAMGADATTMNPIYWGSIYDLEILESVYDTLVGYDINNEPTPIISTSWTYLPDESAIVFDLHSDMKWHDGTAMTAEDIRWNFEDLYKADFDDNGEQDIPRNSWLFEFMINTTVVSPTQIKVFFTYTPKLSDLLIEIGGSWILPEHIWDPITDYAAFTNDDPIGSGPFKFEEWEKGQYFRLTRNADYYLDGPNIDTKIVEIIREVETGYYKLSVGELQILGAVPPELEAIALNDPNIEIHMNLEDFWMTLGMNQRRYPNNVKEFRQAVYYGVNVQEIIDISRFGRGAHMPASGNLPWGTYYNPDARTYEHSVTLANETLDSIGFTDKNGDGWRQDANDTRLSFDFFVSSDFESSVTTGKLMVEWMEAIGIEINLKPLLFDVIWDQIGGSGLGEYNYDWYYIGWVGFWSDRHSGWADWLYSANGYWGGTINLPGWEGAAYDQMTNLTELIKFETDETVIKSLLDEVQVLAAEELPYIALDIVAGVSLYRTDMFDGWLMGNVTGPNNFYSFNNIWQIGSETESVITIVTTIDGVLTTILSTITDTPGFGILAGISSIFMVTILSVKYRKRKFE